MEILQLRYFYESAMNENFSKTADKYAVPVSSVSASVKRLEAELGCKLFDRDCNHISLNANGKRLQQAVRTVFAELDNASFELSAQNGDHREIKMLVRAMRTDITDYIIEYNKERPHITFDTVFDFKKTDFENYDIIIDERNDVYRDYESFELFNLKIRLLVSSQSALVTKKCTLNQLKNQSFVSLGEESNMHRILTKACMDAGFAPKFVARINDIRCHEKMIESGIGIGLGRENKKKQNPKISYIDVSDFDERYRVYIYYKKQSAYGNVLHFLNFLESKKGQDA